MRNASESLWPIKIWYKQLPTVSRVSWPIVEIHVSHRNMSLPQPIFSLIDSGSDSSVLHPDIADVLGINLKRLGKPEETGKSVSGAYRWWSVPDLVDVEMYGHSFQFSFLVVDNPSLLWPCILGGDSIFQVARLDFRKFKGYFEIHFR